MFIFFISYVFWGVEQEYEISVWRLASKNRFFPDFCIFSIENDNGGPVGKLGF